MRRDDLRSQDRVVAAGHLAFRWNHSRQHRLRQPARNEEQIHARRKQPSSTDLCAACRSGYDTVIKRREQHQRRREAAADDRRAFLADPSLLILDEATSWSTPAQRSWCSERWPPLTLDPRLVIAHRLSTIRDADLIW